MEQYGPRTQAFRTFSRQIGRAYSLASIVSRGGTAAIDEERSFGDAHAERVTDCAMAALARLSRAELAAANARASREDRLEMEWWANRLQHLNHMAREMGPHVLFIYLVTLFKAYLENAPVAMYRTRPHLLAGPEQKKYAKYNGANPAKQADRDVAVRVNLLFFRMGWGRIGRKVLSRSLDVPFDDICWGPRPRQPGWTA